MIKTLKKIFKRINKLVRNNDFRLYLVFVAITSVIWFIEQFRDNYTLTIDYTINCSNIPEHFVIKDDTPPSIQVTLRGDGTNLMSLKESDLALNLDIAKTNKKLDKNTIQAYIVPRHYISNIKNKINDDNITIVSVSPDTLTIPLLTISKKEVPVVVRCNVKADAQHILADQPLLEPAKIYISGTNDIIDNIDTIYTETHKDLIVNDTTTIDLKLIVPKDAIVSHKNIKATYTAELYTEKTLNIPVSAINVPEGYTFKAFPQTVKVKFAVGMSTFEKVTEKDFIVTADLQNVTPGSGTSRIKLRLSSSPKEAINTSYSPIFIEYLLEKSKNKK